MGCHTWYRKPIVKGKAAVQQYLRDKIEHLRKKDWWNEECENEALISLHAIDQLTADSEPDLLDTACVDDSLRVIDGELVIFVAATGYDTDEPRIGGYPDTIIRSADAMFEAMQTGLTNWQGKHFTFYWDKDREDRIRENITEFFKHHPDGIIEFG